MKQNFPISKLLVCAVWLGIILMTGCFATGQLTNQSLQPYDHQLYINYLIYNQGDGSRLRIVFPKGDFVFKVEAFGSYKNETPLFSIEQEIKASDDKELEVLVAVSEMDYLLDIQVTDIDNDRRYRNVEPVSRSVNSPAQILFSDISGDPLLYNDVKKEEEVIISHADPSIEQLFVHYFPDTFAAALPPYSIYKTEFNPEKGSDINFTLKNGQAFIPEKEGLFFVRGDTSAPGGKFLNCFQNDFPKLTKATRLIESIRFITKNEEFDKMIKASDQKKALDVFWLERSGSKDRARVLIRTYYNRIRNANIYFTDAKEGWKTDRGMIYTIFGAPQKVHKTENTEFWWYDSTNSRPTADFLFEKKYQQFILKRSPGLELPWNAEIFEWRQGIIR